MNKYFPKIGLGTVQFGTSYGISNSKGQTSSKEVSRILKTAQEFEINLLDTASAYGNAEKILGKNDLSCFKVISKFMPPSNNTGIKKQFEQSIADLNINNLYGYLAHRPSCLLNNYDHWEELQILKQEGKVNKIGFSLNAPHELNTLIENNMQPDLIQVPYNYYDRRFEKIMISMKKAGCEIHSRSTFLQGLFFVNADNLSKHFNEIKPSLTKLQSDFKNLNGALLRFVVSKKFIDQVIVGVENRYQLIENLESISEVKKLPELKIDLSNNILNPSNWPKSI